jgi:ribosomal protein L19E
MTPTVQRLKLANLRERNDEKVARVSVESCRGRLGGYEEGRSEEEAGWMLKQSKIRYDLEDYRQGNIRLNWRTFCLACSR